MWSPVSVVALRRAACQ